MSELLPDNATGRTAEELSSLLHLIYSAASDASLWPQVLTAVARSLKGRSGVLFTPYLPPQEKGMYHAMNITPEQSMLWATKYLELDLWTNRAFERGLVTQGAVITDVDTATEAEFLSSRIYQELFSTMDVGRFCSGVIFDNSADGIPATAITTHRSLQAPPFSQQDRAWLKLLLPHLSRSLGLMYRIDSTRLMKESLFSALDALPLAVLLLNPASQMVHANRAARTLLARQDGLTCDPNGLLDGQAATPAEPRLADWLRKQSQPETADVLHFTEAFLLERTQGHGVYAVQCCPIDGADIWQLQGQMVGSVVLISDPSALILPSVERLVSLYGLTPAQARVASTLARGKGSKEVARELGISPNTVRTQTKDIYLKMRVHSQGDLMRAILTLGQASV